MLLPALSKARNKAKLATCAGNLKQFGLVISMYKGDYNGFFPDEAEVTWFSKLTGNGKSKFTAYGITPSVAWCSDHTPNFSRKTYYEDRSWDAHLGYSYFAGRSAITYTSKWWSANKGPTDVPHIVLMADTYRLTSGQWYGGHNPGSYTTSNHLYGDGSVKGVSSIDPLFRGVVISNWYWASPSRDNIWK